MAHRSKEYDAMLHDTVALIAYEQPEVCEHVFAACVVLLSLWSHRNAVLYI